MDPARAEGNAAKSVKRSAERDKAGAIASRRGRATRGRVLVTEGRAALPRVARDDAAPPRLVPRRPRSHTRVFLRKSALPANSVTGTALASASVPVTSNDYALPSTRTHARRTKTEGP